MLVGKAGPAALFHFVGQLPHRLLRNRATFSTREGSLRRVNGGQNLRPSALALFPQGKRFLYCVFLAVKASAFNRLANKRFLIGRKLHFHAIRAAGSPLRKPCLASTLSHLAAAAPNRSALLQAWKWSRPRIPAHPGKMQWTLAYRTLAAAAPSREFQCSYDLPSGVRCQVSGVRK